MGSRAVAPVRLVQAPRLGYWAEGVKGGVLGETCGGVIVGLRGQCSGAKGAVSALTQVHGLSVHGRLA